MSYRNPTQYIDKSLGRDIQQLQSTITGVYRDFGKSYAKSQSEAAANVRRETARKTKIATDISARKLTMKKGLSELTAGNNSYDFNETFQDELKVYDEYSNALINNTIDDPSKIAMMKHRMKAFEEVSGVIKKDLGIMGSYSDGIDEKMNAVSTFGGYYLGGQGKGLEYMQVLVNNLKGARQVKLGWSDEKASYNVDYVNTPDGDEPISINSNDLRAGDVGAKEIVPVIPDPTDNKEAALKASRLYEMVRGVDGKERETLNEDYLNKQETIDDPKNKGSKLIVQKINKDKFKTNTELIEASKAYIAGLEPDDREALNNGIFAAIYDKDDSYIPPYGSDEEVNKKNDELVLQNYIQYQADSIVPYKLLSKVQPEKPTKTKPPTEGQLDKAKSIELRAGAFAAALDTQESLEKALEKVNISDKRVITDTGKKDGKILGYIAKKGDKEYRFMIDADERETLKKMLEFDGKLSDNQINVQLDKLFPLKNNAATTSKKPGKFDNL